MDLSETPMGYFKRVSPFINQLVSKNVGNAQDYWLQFLDPLRSLVYAPGAYTIHQEALNLDPKDLTAGWVEAQMVKAERAHRNQSNAKLRAMSMASMQPFASAPIAANPFAAAAAVANPFAAATTSNPFVASAA
ncbi:hypothetical protein GPECTOR_88g470 [Gonium pectorale]|uniref:Uncharacterized protein n=1 Tax=Gonium pectorale TaxID=33097 RepID=A0A150G112_GONPE|nr:hypothetical protein GPECTOR_88g470 [Gonium pectorale]|eukprot:KXZ43527.1 hypothetical protein GPECTOR_88g470 [Gonium pectorale]